MTTHIEIKKGSLLRNKHTKQTGTVVCDPYTKLFRDSSDWEAMRAGGGDYATAATAIRVVFHENGYEKVYKLSEARGLFEVHDGATVSDIYTAAGLVAEEISSMPSYIEGSSDDFLCSTAFDKLFNYFMDTNEMPYHVAKARTECPDEWILSKLGEL
jgi:hypothetical protein